MDDAYFSTQLSPHSNDKNVKGYTKASLSGAQATATQKALVQQKRFPRREGTRQFDPSNSLNLCAPGPNGCYEEVEHWIFEPELLTMSNHGSQSKVGNGNGKGFYNLPKLKNSNLIADAGNNKHNRRQSFILFITSTAFQIEPLATAWNVPAQNACSSFLKALDVDIYMLVKTVGKLNGIND